MRRNIFHDKINAAYGNRKNKFLSEIFWRNFELLNKEIVGWIPNFLLIKRKLSHYEEIAYVFFVKKETLRFVTSYEIRFNEKLCTLIFLP